MDRNKRGINIDPIDDQEAPVSGPSGSSAGRVTHKQVRTMTIIAFVRMHKKKIKLDPADLEATGQQIVKLCLEKNVRPTEVQDARFGTIRLYPEWILREFFKLEG